ncbi:hypothetical protein [Paraburkholderia sp. RL18-085-BIA-A]|jgi:hypothetical protein|uniref:hypothetical protein n=1 Tax=Paraburkholderia sp. RL18-085-BIA-A TaxID=3031633 RepID=UPI0038BBC4C2
MKPLTIEEMQAIAAARGGRFLSKEYVNSHTPLEWECARATGAHAARMTGNAAHWSKCVRSQPAGMANACRNTMLTPTHTCGGVVSVGMSGNHRRALCGATGAPNVHGLPEAKKGARFASIFQPQSGNSPLSI